MGINWLQVIELILALIGAASILLKVIAPMTKTKKDDKVLKVLLKILEISSLHVKKK